MLTSDVPQFHSYVKQIFSVYFRDMKISSGLVYQFLIIIHKDLSADLYLNGPPIVLTTRPKKAVSEGEIIYLTDVADVLKLGFEDVTLSETDKVICCFKVDWKFALLFDFRANGKLDVDKIYTELASLYRYLSFQGVYEAFEPRAQYEEIKKRGWFPFVEILDEYDSLIKVYDDKFAFEGKLSELLNRFDKDRINKITGRWWAHKAFKEKEKMLKAGINAFLRGDDEGYIQSIKTLYTEIEGILLFHYFRETGKGSMKMSDLLDYVLQKGRVKSGSDQSFFFPLKFFEYLRDVLFADFDLESQKTDISRHTVSHGVADVGDYTKERAVQAILILDQIYFYL